MKNYPRDLRRSENENILNEWRNDNNNNNNNNNNISLEKKEKLFIQNTIYNSCRFKKHSI